MKTIRIGNTDHALSPEVFAAFLDIGARGDSLQQRVDDLEDENKTLRLAHELVSDGRDKAEARVSELEAMVLRLTPIVHSRRLP